MADAVYTIVEDHTTSEAGDKIDIGNVALQSVQIKDQGSFTGTVDIEISNADDPGSGDWVVASNGDDLAAGVLVNIAEDARWARANVTHTAGTVRIMWALLGRARPFV